MLSYLSLALLISSVILVLFRRFFIGKGVRHIRGPSSPSLLFGHEHALTYQAEAGSLELQWMGEYGSTWRTRGIFGTDVLMTVDPKALQHIFHKSGYNYTKKTSQYFLGWLMTGPGIATVLGEDHQRHRKIMNPAFSATRLRSFLPLFQRIANKLSEKWKGEITSADQLDILMNKWLARATLDVIGEAAFDFDYSALNDGERSAISKGYENIFKDIDYQPAKATLLFRAVWDFIPVPILRFILYLPMDPFKRLRNLNGLFEAYGRQIIREKQPEIDAEKQVNSKDVMSILIKANSSADSKTRLSDEELIAEMSTLTLAGHETTSSTLTFLLYELAKHPEYQARMREEIKDVRAKALARGDVDLTTEDLDSLTLTVNAIKETLRFHPIVIGLPRVAVKDDVIPLAHPIVSSAGETITEIPVRAGQVVFASFIGYQRLKEVWGEDADEWNPDRFFRTDTGKQTNVGVFANLMTFSAGVRGCIGWRFSVIEMQAFLSELLQHFQFDLPSEKMDIQRAVAGSSMVPLVRGKEHLGVALPLRVSLVRQTE